MSSFEVTIVGALALLALLTAAQLMMSRELRKGLERLARGEAARMMLAQREVTMSAAPAGPVAPLPKLSAEPAREASPTDASTRAERTTRVAVGPGARQRLREPFKPPALASIPNYAEQARRPAPDSDDPPESRAGATVLPPPPDAAARAAPELRAPAAEQPDVGAPHDLRKLGLALDAADQAQAEPSPDTRVPTTRPPPSSQQAPARSGANVAIGPPDSGRVLSPAPGIVAAGLGARPSDRHGAAGGTRGARSERPPPHRPPQPIRKATLLGIHSAPVAPARPRSADGRDDRPSEPDDEETRLLQRPPPEALGLAPAAPQQPSPPQPPRRIAATLASMPAFGGPSGRVSPPVEVRSAGDDERSTVKPGDGAKR